MGKWVDILTLGRTCKFQADVESGQTTGSVRSLTVPCTKKNELVCMHTL